LRVVYAATHDLDDDETALKLLDTPQFTLALLKSSYSESMSQSVGSRSVRRRPQLAWEILVQVCGDEDDLKRRIDALDAAGLEGTDELLSLAKRYATGWRPKDFDDD
jgi:hypothetical protein